jgi:hypothetical protein
MEDLLDKLGANKVTQAITTNHFQQGHDVTVPSGNYIDLLDLPPQPLSPHSAPQVTSLPPSVAPPSPPNPSPPPFINIQPLLATLTTLHTPEASLLYGSSLQKAVDEFKKTLRDFVSGSKTTKSVKETTIKALHATTVDPATTTNLIRVVAHLLDCNVLVHTNSTLFQSSTSPDKVTHLIVGADVVLSETLSEVKDYLIQRDLYDDEAIHKLFSVTELRKLAQRKGVNTKLLKKDLIQALTLKN